MSTQQVRQPALARRVNPVDEAIPDRVHAQADPAPAPAPAKKSAKQAGEVQQREPLNTSLQVRVRATTRERLDEAVRKLQYERKDRSVSMSSLIDEIADAWLTQHKL